MQKYLILAVMLGHAGFSLAGIERQIKQAIQRSELSEVKQLVASRQGTELSLFELKKLADVAVDSIVERTFLVRKPVERWWMLAAAIGALTSTFGLGKMLICGQENKVADDQLEMMKNLLGLDDNEAVHLRAHIESSMKGMEFFGESFLALVHGYLVFRNYYAPARRLAEAKAIRDVLKTEVAKRENASSQKGAVLAV